MLSPVVEKKLSERLARFEELEATINSPEGAMQPNYPDLLRECGSLRASMEKYREYRRLAQEQADNPGIADDKNEDPEMREMARAELDSPGRLLIHSV